MANRRMFAKTIVETGEFYSLSVEAQTLYFHAGMIADDEGFADCFFLKNVIRNFDEAISELIDDGYLRHVPVKGLVYYVTNWTENNQIRGDRFTPSKYHDYLLQMTHQDYNIHELFDMNIN